MSIKTITAPSVYLLGRQEVEQSEVDRFLADHGVAWGTDTEVAAESLCETAGRVCYMSFTKPRPGGNEAYLKHIKQVGHGSVLEHAVWNLLFTGVSRSLTHELVRHRVGCGYCLTGDTLIYSERKVNGRRNGPKKRRLADLYEMTKTPHGRSRLKLLKLRCFDGEEFVTTKVKAVVCSGEKDIVRVTLKDGKTVRCSADHLFFTPDGWVPVRELVAGVPLATNGLAAVGLDKEWLRQKYHDENLLIEDIARMAKCSPATVSKWIRLYGLAKQKGKGMTGRRPWNKGRTYTAGWHHSEVTRKLLGAMKQGELNPQWKGDDASPSAGRLRAWRMYPQQPCEACGTEDGHRHHIDRNTLNNSPENIAFLCSSCHTKRHNTEDEHPNVLTVRWVPIVAIEPDGSEMTYDLEVEHPAHNFLANGIVTHNSQLSQRYVDESVAEYVVPPALQREVEAALFFRTVSVLYYACRSLQEAADVLVGTKYEGMSLPEFFRLENAGRDWLDAVETTHSKYVQLADYLSEKEWVRRYDDYLNRVVGGDLEPLSLEDFRKSKVPEADPTAVRKEARQAARSVLPNATETKIFVTMNARAWRHFIEMRASRHADTEIRILAVAAWRVLVRESPNLFSDYDEVSLPDGTVELTTPHRKV